MKELLMKRKGKFLIYVIACFFPVVDSMLQISVFSMFFRGIQNQDMQYFKGVVLLAIGAAICCGLLHVCSRLMRIGFMRDVILDVRKIAFDKILHQSYKTFSKQSKEVYMSHLINDVNTFENNFFLNLLNAIFMGGLYTVSIILLLFMNFKMALVMIAISVAMFGFARLFSNKTEALQEQVSGENEQFTTEMGNTFNGLEILKLNNMDHKFLDKSLVAINRVEKRKVAFTIYSEQQRSFMMFMSYVVLMGIIVYICISAQGETLDMGKQMFMFQLCSNTMFPLVEILPRMNIIKSSARIYEKITKVEAEDEKIKEANEAFVFTDKIEVKNLDFAYDQQTILKQATFTLEKGKKYLIKGVSGAGKSTLMKLLAMIYDEYQGELSVDGVDYKALDERSFNDQVAFVYQDVFLFEDTIRNNISLYKEVAEGVVETAAEKASLTEFLDSKDEGLDTFLHENGKNLSGGQRQRISIARALAKNAQILFVDEGTSALNEEMGRQIEEELLNLDCTVVAISHRFYEGVTNQYDYILEIKNQRVNTYDAKQYYGEVVVC